MTTPQKAGAWYEQFTREVYQALVSQDAIRNIDVRHDVILVGRSGASHQIDVFWEFEIAGSRYKTCVECKAYASPVKKAQIAAFSAILADIGNATGIFVTTQGYQSGAQKFARDRHIRLIVLNPTINTIEIDMQLISPVFLNVDIKLDNDACKPLVQAAGRTSFTYSVRGTGDTVILVDARGGKICTLNDFVRKQPSTSGHHDVSLAGHFLPTDIGPLPLASISYDLELHETREKLLISAEDAARAVVEDVLANTRQYVREDGTASFPENMVTSDDGSEDEDSE